MARPDPIFTIVTINFNNAVGLGKTIRSVVSQSHSAKEYVVVDGGSTDASLDVIRMHQSEIDGIVRESDRGIYDAMNKGVELAHGEWVIFLNSGDIFATPDALDRIAAMIPSNADILLGDAIVLYSDGTSRLQKAQPPEEIPYGMVCSHQSMLVRRTLLLSMPFTVGKMRSDYEFTLRAWKSGRRFKLLDLVIAQVAAGGWSDRNRIRSLGERWSLLRGAGPMPPPMFLHFAVAYFFALLSLFVRFLLPAQAVSAMRKFKLRYLGERSSRG